MIACVEGGGLHSRRKEYLNMNKILEVASIPRVLANNSLGHRVSMNVCQKMTLERKKTV